MEVKKDKKINLLEKGIKRFKKTKKPTKIIILLTIVIIILMISLGIATSELREIKFRAESSLEEIVDKNELQTVRYTYNAIAKQCKKSGCNKESENSDDYKYFVSYEGTVSAGINFDNVKVDVDSTKKELVITIPEPVMTGHNVEIGTLKFIFTNDKYNEASELQEAYKLCLDDLKSRSEKDELVLKTAKQNSISVLQKFFEEWIKIYNKEYKVIVK